MPKTGDFIMRIEIPDTLSFSDENIIVVIAFTDKLMGYATIRMSPNQPDIYCPIQAIEKGEIEEVHKFREAVHRVSFLAREEHSGRR